MPRTDNLPDYEPVTKRKGRTSTRLDTAPQKSSDVTPELVQAGTIPVSGADASQATRGRSAAKAVIKRGHTLSFIGLFLFTFLLYFRPYEFSPSLSWLMKSAFWAGLLTLVIFTITQVAVEGRLSVPQREINLVLLFACLTLLSIPGAIDPALAWTTFQEFLKPVLMFIVLVNVVRTERRFKIMLLLALAVSCLISIGAVKDYLTGNLKVEGYRVMGIVGNLFDNPNSLALHLVTMIPIVAALSFAAGNVIKKLLYASLAMVMIAAITVSFSRGGFLGLVISLGVLTWKLRKRHPIVVILVAAVTLMMFLALIPSGYGTRLASSVNLDLDPAGSAGVRKDLLWRSIIVALRHPLLGIGIGNFPIMGIGALSTHNAYTQVASETGMTALVVYVMFMVVPFKRLSGIEKATYKQPKNAGAYYLAIGLQASLVGFMVSSFFAHVAYQWYIYYLVGYAVCFTRIFEADEYFRRAKRSVTQDSAAGIIARD